MNELQATIVQSLDACGEPYLGLQLQVDGRSLLDWLKHAEGPMAEAEGDPSLAGAYGWVPMSPGLLRDLQCQVGDEQRTVVVLDCPCGVPGCWSLSTRLSFDQRQVVWSHFEQSHRRWSYDQLGPFVFDRVEYERALNPSTPSLISWKQGRPL